LLTLIPTEDMPGWPVAALLGEGTATHVLDELVESGLLARLGTDVRPCPRYSLPDCVRQHVMRYVDEDSAEHRESARRRVLTGWLELSDLADRRLPRAPGMLQPPRIARRTVLGEAVAHDLVRDPVAWFYAEQSTLAAVFTETLRAGELLVADRLIAYQGAYLHFSNQLGTAAGAWHALARHARRAGNQISVARAELQHASVLVQAGLNDQVTELLERSLEVLAEQNDPGVLAIGEYLRSAQAQGHHHFSRCRQHAERGVWLARKARDRSTELLNLAMLGMAHAQLGRYRLGELYSGQALVLARQLGEPSYERLAANTLARIPAFR
jgi:hypothetical protein